MFKLIKGLIRFYKDLKTAKYGHIPPKTVFTKAPEKTEENNE